MATSADPKHVEPYIGAATVMREFTARAVITGAILGMIFGASSLYLVLKVGLTVSASIPVAVISLALFRGLSKTGLRDATILEHNITQTAGSAGESLAFGIGVTMPAILILGFDLELTRVMLVAMLGGLLGILMMIPLRRALIVKEHGTLKYPEGTACAAVLKAGANADDKAHASPSAQAEIRAAAAAGLGAAPGAKAIFTGFGVGLIYTTFNIALKGWKDVSEKVFGAPFKAGSVSVEVSPALLGVGYIIGPRIASIMCAGGVLSYLALIPMIKFFGESMTTPLEPGTKLISDMSPGDIRSAYVLYIGAGAVAAGGIISLVQAMPTIWHGLKEGLRNLNGSRGSTLARDETPRTERDLSLKFVGIGVVLLLLAITFAPSLEMNFLGALLIVLFGFLFVTVSSRLTGEIGSSSNPISGMTVATLLFTCLIFLLVGWTGRTEYVTALSVGAIVCIAASNGGTTSQDLKTGFLLGATPKLQQWAIMAGAALSAVCLGPVLLVLNDASTVYVPIHEIAPAGLHTDVGALKKTEGLKGPQARDDANSYLVWQKTDNVGAPEGRYLVNQKGEAVWLVDPGINGTHNRRPDGSLVQKFDAPKATLMSYIIKGILDRKLPWALVLLGVMIAVTMEMSFVPALAFAVGVYLPLSSSSPIFFGGFVRWLVDRRMRKKAAYAAMTPAQFTEETDKSPGVLLASGYIAGGAIAGIIIAIMQGVPWFEGINDGITTWSTAHNPFFDGPNSDLLTLVPFAVLCILLYLVGREKLLAGRLAGPMYAGRADAEGEQIPPGA
ncbi:oligopeptide transporter, OPT family [Horticoccus luteus]|uniref:Oligopeptide transporter, OPT family n=1 Tax=Horticoccus luteus TaxID=2862869 RepID=A0A8F9TXU6_9BACT|nr:oligopeptide transporter, OPT family [Horticoccus luteus]QYM79849.1 oligopeptide transporter, OPT family [Horticoccus luteus]